MRKNKIKIPYERGQGVKDLHLLDDLATSQENIEKTKRVFINNLNNAMPSLKINKWICLVFPFGLLLIILAAILLRGPYSVLVILLGVFVICLLPIYYCVKWSNLVNTINSTVKKIETTSNNELKCTPKYKKKVRRTNASIKSYKHLNFFCVEVNQYEFVKRRKKSERMENELKNEDQYEMEGAGSDKEGVGMKHDIENTPMVDHFETNPDNRYDHIPIRKDTDAFEINELENNHKKDLFEEKGPDLKVDMIEMGNK